MECQGEFSPWLFSLAFEYFLIGKCPNSLLKSSEIVQFQKIKIFFQKTIDKH